jgi:3-hydroxy acid dehydrogenase / malonic semialdehyde reductase
MAAERKTVFITGATSGFGLACARKFAQGGAAVIISGRRQERLEEIGHELEKTAPVHALPLDVRDNAAVKAAIAALPPEFSSVDILVNNAGLALGTAGFEFQPMDDLEQMVQTNIMGVIYCTHALLPGMIARNRGHIFMIGSIAGSYPYPGGNVYGGTKAFVSQFALNLRADLLGKNIRVTSMEPGMAETEFSLVRFHGDADKAGMVYQGVEALTGQDVAEAVFWCAAQPEHVNVNRMELMPTQQAFSAFAVNRSKKS